MSLMPLMSKAICVLLALYLALQVYDYATTEHRLVQPGWGEKKPWTEALILRFGLNRGLAIAKLFASAIGCLIAACGLFIRFPYVDIASIVWLGAFVAYYARITHNNAHRGN